MTKPAEAKSTTARAVYDDSKQPIQEAPGQGFRIALTSNAASTGYTWTFEGSPRPDVVKHTGHAFEPPADPTRIGSPGRESWDFEAVGPGEVTLRFVHGRSWEPDSASTTTFTVRVSSH